MPAPDQRYRHPRRGRSGSALAVVLNWAVLARVRQACMARLGFMQMASDVRDVLYLTWMVDAAKARSLVPGLRLRESGGMTPLTILSYRHGHFGPRLAGRWRRLLPSPLQSNWRLYLDDGATGRPGVYFITNIMDSLAYVAGTRLFSDIMQTHLAQRFTLAASGDGVWQLDIEAGQGSAVALSCSARQTTAPCLPPAFSAAYGDWQGAVAGLVLQERALGWSERLQRMVEAEISLPVDTATVLPLTVLRWDCPLLAQLGATAAPLAFLVPRVAFAVLSERLLPLPHHSSA